MCFDAWLAKVGGNWNTPAGRDIIWRLRSAKAAQQMRDGATYGLRGTEPEFSFREVMARVREMHGGQDYDPAFGRRMTGEGLWADLLAQRFAKASARLGLASRMPPLRCDLFRPPTRPGDQLSLF